MARKIILIVRHIPSGGCTGGYMSRLVIQTGHASLSFVMFKMPARRSAASLFCRVQTHSVFCCMPLRYEKFYE